MLPVVWRETPDCNISDRVSGATTAMHCPAKIHEKHHVDVCIEHGETRVLKSKGDSK